MDVLSKLFPKKEKLTQDQLRLKVLLKDFSLNKLDSIAKEFISRDPKVQYKDADGILQTKKPNREDYIQSILKSVSYDSVERFIKK